MKLVIMQQYFLPYIGYFQLMAAAHKFVIYDDVNFIKSGWTNSVPDLRLALNHRCANVQFARGNKSIALTVCIEAVTNASREWQK